MAEVRHPALKLQIRKTSDSTTAMPVANNTRTRTPCQSRRLDSTRTLMTPPSAMPPSTVASMVVNAYVVAVRN